MDERTMFEKMANRRLPEYYDGMHRHGYKPWEILEAAHKSMIKQHEARLAEQEESVPMNVHFQVEVKKK